MDACKPYCQQSQADKMRLRYLLADISLGVGVVALGAGGYLYFSASKEPTGTAWRGGSVGVRGSF
jgi:c-di-GMP-binding flagellar brake protein YcgR